MKEIKTQGVKICDADLENICKIANRYEHVSVPEVTSKAFLGPFIIQ